MADSPILPGAHAWRDGSGKPLPPEFFRFLRDLTTYVRRTQGDSLELGEIEARISALESASNGSLNGLQSVEVVGAGSNEVLLQLRGDEASPNPLHYYGTDDAGAKGFHELPSGGVPYFIPAGTTFRVREHLQALTAMPIDCEGFLDIEGFLIEVD